MPSRCISHRRIADGLSPVNSEGFQAGMARCSTISTGRSVVSPIPTLLSTTGSRTMTRPAKSSRLGMLPCVGVISVAWGLPLAAPAVGARVPLEAQLLLLALLPAVVELAVEVPLLHRSLLAAMAGSLPSPAKPRY